MKILIVSDSHGRCYYLERAYNRVKPIDLLIHLGDLEGDEQYIRAIAECPVELVAGNNDYFTNIPREKMIQVGNYNVMLTHGNRYGVNAGVDHLKYVASLNGADIVMFGHTHHPLIDLKDDTIWAINPGSITLPRQLGKIPTFIVMDIDSSGKAHFNLNFADDNLG